MKILPNPRIAGHTAKLVLSIKVLSPIILKYLRILNEIRPTHDDNANEITSKEDVGKSRKNNNITPDDLLKNFANIPHRNISKATEIIPHIHLSFRLLWTQLALLLASSQENKPLYQIVANVPAPLLVKATKSAKNKIRKTTLIRELLRLPVKKLPSDIKLWAVFEKGRSHGGAHIHIIVALDNFSRELLKSSLSDFESVKFKNHTELDGERAAIDIGAGYYYAKSVNDRYYGNSNLYITPALRIKSKAVERDYRSFIADNKPFLLNDKNGIQRSIEAFEKRRLADRPKTFEEWEARVLNQPTEELDTSVMWQVIEDNSLWQIDRLITSLEK